MKIIRVLNIMLVLSPSLLGDGVESALADFRESTARAYYDDLGAPFSVAFYVDDDIVKQGFNARNINEVNSIGGDRAPGDNLSPNEVLQMGEQLLHLLRETSQVEGANTNGVSLRLLARPQNGGGELLYDRLGLDSSEALYRDKPSSSLALGYLEVALAYRRFGDLERCSDLLNEANELIGLEGLDFTGDRELRSTLPVEFNFGRPESAILYLRAQIALRESRVSEAAQITRKLVVNNPTDPYAWQSLREFGHQLDLNMELVDLVTDVYPIVFGTKQFELALNSVSKPQFMVFFTQWLGQEWGVEVIERDSETGLESLKEVNREHSKLTGRELKTGVTGELRPMTIVAIFVCGLCLVFVVFLSLRLSGRER